MQIEQALQFADQWSEGHTFYEGSQGWRVVCAVLAAEVRRLRASPKPLTDEQLVNIADGLGIGSSAMLRKFAQAIEKAHGIAQGDERCLRRK